MAKKVIQNGQFEHGTVHAMEEEMRAAEHGVFEPTSTAPSRKNAGASPANKARTAAPEDKSLSAMTKAELVETAEAEGVTVETDDNKADLVRKIEKARK